MMKILGIDEAGRGPVIGPMIIAGVLIDAEKEEKLRELGVKDSKLLSKKRREELARKIREEADTVQVVEVSAADIDKMRKRMSLNELEAMKMAELIENLKPDKVIADLPDPTSLLFKRRIMKYCSHKPEFVLEHKADQKYPVVSAASIIAKTVRDDKMKKIEEKYEAEIGTGYPHDERTIRFLQAHASKYPVEVRKSWSTARRHKRPQKKLSDYS